MPYVSRSISERLNMYSKPVASGCIEWQRKLDKNGYGRLLVIVDGVKKTMKAHRLSYEHHNGKIPDGMMVCHSCDNPSCINPQHLFVGTASDNNQDMMSKGRHRPGRRSLRGERNGNAKLSWEDVESVRKRVSSGETRRSVAKSLGMHRSTIERICLFFSRIDC